MNPPTHPSATLSEPPPAPALLPFPSGHKRNGTVPHLPKATRLYNALARLNREALLLRKYNDLCAKTQAAELPRLDPNRELAEKERDMLWAGVQRAFGFKPDRQIGPTLPELYARSLAAQ